jgi:hypothetical protein
VDAYSIFKPVFFVSKVLGLSPYSAVGDIGNRKIIVTVSVIIYSLGLFILNVGVFAYFIFPSIIRRENICISSENILYHWTICHAVSAYCTSVLGCRQTPRHFERLEDLIGKTYYSAWRKGLQLLLAMKILRIIIIVTAGVLEMSEAISQFNYLQPVLVLMLYCVTDHAGFRENISSLHLCKYSNALFRTGISIWMLLVKMMYLMIRCIEMR